MSCYFVHKYYLVFCIALVCTIFSSCKATVDEDVLQADDDSLRLTLRDTALQKTYHTGWTEALEADRLNRDTTHHDGVADSIALTPQVMAVSRVDEEAVFPLLDGFGSLDTSTLTGEVRHVLDSLMASIRNGTDITALMADGMEHQAAFFADDVKAALSLPDVKYEIDAEDTAQSGDVEQLSDAAATPLNIVAIYGEPFFGNDGSIIVKIRLTFEERVADAEVALISDNYDADNGDSGTNAYEYKIVFLTLKPL